MATQLAILPPALAQALPAQIGQVRSWGAALLGQPAVRRALPLILALLVVIAGAGGWMWLREPDYRPLFAQLAEADRAAVLTALKAGNFHARINASTGAVEIADSEVATARIMLAGQGLPKAAPTGYDLLGAMPLGTSRAVETARLRQAQESELAASIAAIDAVEHASVHLAVGETSVFIRDRADPSASVFVQLAPGRALGEAQVRAIVHLVASSVAGLAPDRVSVVDQSGALLSGDPASGAGLGGEIQRQLAYQARVEGQYRQRIITLLTPMLGNGNFSTEVSADVDFSQTEATRENYDRDGSVLRSEQGSSSQEAGNAPARGIPGALSNTVPPAATASATPPEASAAAATAGPKSESYARNFEVGRAVSVTRAQVGQVRRLSVAVVVRDADPAKPNAKAQAVQIEALTGLVRSAVGFDARRGDVVTVASRPFAAASEGGGDKWYEKPVVHDSGMAVVAIAGLAMLVFGIARPLLKRRAAAPVADMISDAPGANPVIADDGSIDYQLKLAQTRSLVAEDVSRASNVVRQMIRADAT